MGIHWEYSGNMMGIWWEYDGGEYKGNIVGKWNIIPSPASPNMKELLGPAFYTFVAR
jgi:hypothetical protein